MADLATNLSIIGSVPFRSAALVHDQLSGGELAYQRNLSSQATEMAYNAEQAKIQRAHELYMSNTAYQRAVQDMKKAGLNPALLAGFGNSAQPASGSSSSAASGSSFRSSAASRNVVSDFITNVAKMSFNAGASIIGAVLKS